MGLWEHLSSFYTDFMLVLVLLLCKSAFNQALSQWSQLQNYFTSVIDSLQSALLTSCQFWGSLMIYMVPHSTCQKLSPCGRRNLHLGNVIEGLGQTGNPSCLFLVHSNTSPTCQNDSLNIPGPSYSFISKLHIHTVHHCVFILYCTTFAGKIKCLFSECY